MQILKKVPAISNVVYTSFGSSRRSTIRRAEDCCFVFSIFMSLLCRENNATSPAAIKNDNVINANNKAPRIIVPSALTARIVKRRLSIKNVITE